MEEDFVYRGVQNLITTLFNRFCSELQVETSEKDFGYRAAESLIRLYETGFVVNCKSYRSDW